ncbi:MAG: family 10 glycosylhydrolase [Eubacteriales bacterium]|nr:family 10 glycosylhydrolase [Eubacteriales bacterium]
MKNKKSSLICLLVMAFLLFLPAKTQAAEYKGIWFSYYDYESFTENYANTGDNFKRFFDGVLDNCKEKGFNHIIVQVRPFSDAIYKSSYFPTSACIAGKQGASLSYDPLAIMVQEAHKKGMRIEAWINPYRVATNTSYKKLAKKNPARKWHYSKKTSYHRYVLSYGGKLYYNPSKPAVRTLIINGVKEIVRKYNVDGIHMDDYFYPSFSSSNYKKAFDAKEYNKSTEKKSGMSIVKYRRKQVNTLVSGIRSAIKSIKPSVTFGISPAGEINNLTDKYSYYVDITKWVTSTKYVDYIAPQIYWGFHHTCAQFDKMVNQWLFITDRSKVKLYIGLPAYKMGDRSAATTSKERTEFLSSGTLAKMVDYGRKNGAHGFIVFDYQDIKRSSIKSHINKLATSLMSIR